jgi:hypothetical protein
MRMRTLVWLGLALSLFAVPVYAQTNPCAASSSAEVKDPKMIVFDRPSDPIVVSVEFLYYTTSNTAVGPAFIGNRRFVSDAQVLFKGSDTVPDCLGYPWMPVTDIKKDGTTRYWSAVRGVDATGRAGQPSERSNPFFFSAPPLPTIPVLTGHRVAP